MNISFRKAGRAFVGVLLIIACAQLFLAWRKSPIPLEVNYLNVGQGDAILINYLGNYQILIDGGPDGKRVLHELGKTMPVQDRSIEIIILTHPDKDHLAGLIEVLKNYKVGLFLDNGDRSGTEIEKDLERLIEQQQVRREAVYEGSEITIGQALQMKIFNPDELDVSEKERNSASIVSQLNFGENSFLFMGDAEEKVEKDLVADRHDIDVDWLKVAHHGSKYASTLDFLNKVTPAQAIISVGKDNRYGHPFDEVMNNLQAAGIEIYRTDEQGSISVECPSLGDECKVRE